LAAAIDEPVIPKHLKESKRKNTTLLFLVVVNPSGCKVSTGLLERFVTLEGQVVSQKRERPRKGPF
jgi:hypothetical protein